MSMGGVNCFLFWANTIVFIYFVLVQSFYLLLLLLAIPELWNRIKEVKQENFDRILKSESVPQISIIIPAHNEKNNIIFNINRLVHLSYPYKEIIVVNNGSNDGCMKKLQQHYNLYEVPPQRPMVLKTEKKIQYFRSQEYPNLLVLNKSKKGKIDAINAGINASSSDYFLTIDADTIISDSALQSLMRPFLMRSNVVAAGGCIGIANGCEFGENRMFEIKFPKKILPSIQVIEYLRAFLFGRLGWIHLGGNLIVSGAFGLFDKQSVIDIGGYQTEIGDDVDVVVRLHRYYREKQKPYFITFIPDLVALTKVPNTVKGLINQRARWHQGVFKAIYRSINMLFNVKYGKVGLIGMPCLFFIEGLSPVIELFGYFIVAFSIYFGLFHWYFAFWYLLLALGFPILLSVICVFMEVVSFKWYFSVGIIFKMLFFSIAEQIGFRQLMVFARLKGIVNWIFKKENWIKSK